MQQKTNSYMPFVWPKKVPRNEEFAVVTVDDEKALNEALAKHPAAAGKPSTLFGTHSGVFHCDEVMASVLLKYAKVLVPPAVIIRTRNEELLKKLKLVYDVGGICDPKKLRYDHHMRDFKGMMGG